MRKASIDQSLSQSSRKPSDSCIFVFCQMSDFVRSCLAEIW